MFQVDEKWWWFSRLSLINCSATVFCGRRGGKERQTGWWWGGRESRLGLLAWVITRFSSCVCAAREFFPFSLCLSFLFIFPLCSHSTISGSRMMLCDWYNYLEKSSLWWYFSFFIFSCCVFLLVAGAVALNRLLVAKSCVPRSDDLALAAFWGRRPRKIP